MRYIVETDWQTSGGWIGPAASPPYAKHPTEKFVRDVWKKCKCVRVDLNRDGSSEIIVEVDVSPGVTGNTSFHIIVQQNGQWRHAGYIGGRTYFLEQRRTPTGYLDIVTVWKNGGGVLTVTTHRYHKGQYRKWRSHVEIPSEGKESLIKERKDYALE